MGTNALRFDDQVAIITGAARGLGAAHARLLASRGARIVLNDRPSRAGDDGSVGAVATQISDDGGEACAVEGSIADLATSDALVDTAIERYGRLDIVVNNAGIGIPHPVGELDAKHLRLEYDVNVVGALMLVDRAWRHLEERGGSIVSTTSGVGLFGLTGGSIGYAAAKMALVGINRVLALEGRERGIRSNLVAPFADTRMAGDVFGDLTPALRPELVSSVVAWLAHSSCQVTGTVVSAGGGRIAEAVTSVGAGLAAGSPEDVASRWTELADDEQLRLGHALEELELIDRVLGRDA